MLGSEALSATTWYYRFSMETTPNIDDVLSGRPGRPGNWAVELGGPKPFRLGWCRPQRALRWRKSGGSHPKTRPGATLGGKAGRRFVDCYLESSQYNCAACTEVQVGLDA
jgi:hypothetical protein